MKKFFLFAAVAGMLASCSSESLTGSDPNIEPTQEDRVPILLSVSSPSIDVARGTTRGTGTVGGVGAGTNVWEGQRIKVFMFDKNSLTLTLDGVTPYYDDTEMITPGTAENLITPAPNATSGEAMISDGTIKYYPAVGNFDFFGYHGDDAITGGLNTTENLWTVPFTINGSQDLMSTKAAPQAWSALTTDQKAKFVDEDAYKEFIDGKDEDEGALKGDFYSAKAARKLIQPVLSFNHLLTRLSFVIKAGDDNAAGWNGTDQVAANAVHVNSIQVESKTKGDMAVAWKEAPTNIITWGDETAYLPLKERPTYFVSANKAITLSDAEYASLPFYYKTADPTIRKSPIEWGALPTDAFYYLKTDPTTTITPAAYASLDDDEKALYAEGDIQGNYTNLAAGECEAITETYANYNLTNLTSTYPTVTPTVPADGTYTADETPIGEALIVSPNGATGYNMIVNVSQLLPQNWTGTPGPAVKYQDYNLPIPAPDGGFLPNTSYKVILTVYGFERIQVITKIIPWQPGADINVGQD